MNKWVDRALVIFSFVAFLAICILSMTGCASKNPTVVKKPTVQPKRNVSVYLHPNSLPYPPDKLQSKVNYFISRTDKFCKESGSPGVYSIMIQHKGNDDWSVTYICMTPPRKSAAMECPLEEKYCEH